MPAIGPAQGPTAAESRMMRAYDVFLVLLNSKPTVAQQLAYEISEIAERYQPKQREGTPPCDRVSNSTS